MNKRIIPAIVIGLVLVFFGTGQLPVSASSGAKVILPPPSDMGAARHPKLEAELYRLAHGGLTRLPAHPGFSLEKRSGLSAGQVRVVLEVENLDFADLVPRLVSALSQIVVTLGGRVETTNRNLIQAVVPISALEPLAANPGVRYVRRPFVPHPLAVTSEGVARTGADAWQKQASFPAGGKTVKICILDVGFQDYQSLLGTELPPNVTVKSFRQDGDIEAGEVHGAACAEIVHDMAPDAQLYLVNFDTDVEQHDAVNWIVQQGVNVISYSIGWTNAGDGRGNGPIDADVEYAHQSGLVWAGSAGNEALNHYRAAFSDTNSNGWHNFEPSNEILEFDVPAFEIVGAFLNWDDWGTWTGQDFTGSNQDYDLYLYIWDGSAWQFIDSSTSLQNGTQWPVEEIYGWYADIDATWGVAIHKVSASHSNQVELFIQGNSSAIEYDMPAGSISQPADSADCVTAGAIDAQGGFFHYYSSQGPTHDGRIKPDFGSPSGVSTATYGHLNFYGTSASAPHLAGAFGLLMQKTPYTLDQISTILVGRAIDAGDPGKDNKFGWGSLNLKK